MKKFAMVLMTVLMLIVLGISGCGEKKDYLVMACNASFPPYEFYSGTTVVGIDAEIAAAIADKLGMELEIVDTEFGSIIGGVETGKYSIGMSGITVTEARKLQVNFSDTYAVGRQVIIVKEGSAITGVDYLFDHIGEVKIGVQQDTTGHIYASGDFGVDNVVAYKTGNDAVQALVTSKVDCVIIDNEPAKSYVEANASAKLSILEAAYTEEDYAIAIGKENVVLLNNINKALAELKADGTIDAILAKYIG